MTEPNPNPLIIVTVNKDPVEQEDIPKEKGEVNNVFDFEMESLALDEDHPEEIKRTDEIKPLEFLILEEEKKGCARQSRGVLFTLLASFLFPMAIIIKSLVGIWGFNPSDSPFLRYAGITILTTPFLIFVECCKMRSNSYGQLTRNSVFSTIWPVHRHGNWKNVLGLLTRSIATGSLAAIWRFFLLQYWTLKDAYVIYYVSPILVTILAHFFLKEKTGFVAIMSAVIAIMGVVVIARPPLFFTNEKFNYMTFTGMGFAMGILFCETYSLLVTRGLREVHPALVLFVYGLLGMIQSLVVTRLFHGFWLPPMSFDTVYISLGIAGVRFLGELFLILGLKYEKAGPVALIRTSEIVFAIFIEFAALGTRPDNWRSIGSSIIIIAVFITIGRKCLKN